MPDFRVAAAGHDSCRVLRELLNCADAVSTSSNKLLATVSAEYKESCAQTEPVRVLTAPISAPWLLPTEAAEGGMWPRSVREGAAPAIVGWAPWATHGAPESAPKSTCPLIPLWQHSLQHPRRGRALPEKRRFHSVGATSTACWFRSMDLRRRRFGVRPASSRLHLLPFQLPCRANFKSACACSGPLRKLKQLHCCDN